MTITAIAEGETLRGVDYRCDAGFTSPCPAPSRSGAAAASIAARMITMPQSVAKWFLSEDLKFDLLSPYYAVASGFVADTKREEGEQVSRKTSVEQTRGNTTKSASIALVFFPKDCHAETGRRGGRSQISSVSDGDIRRDRGANCCRAKRTQDIGRDLFRNRSDRAAQRNLRVSSSPRE
jgi:hypothetical protein